MKKAHTHYDNLKVARNAPIEVIRAAFKTLSQKYHPDKNAGDEAHKIMLLINAAYDVLSDPEKRQQHDAWILQQEQALDPPEQEPPRQSTGAGDVNGAYFSQHGQPSEVMFRSLSTDTRHRLIQRVLSTRGDVVAFPLDRVGWKYCYVVILLCWFFFLFHASGDSRWSFDASAIYAALTLIAAFLLGVNLVWIYRWHTSPLKSMLLITPLYLIKTQLDRIAYWPIWAVGEMKATHSFSNGSYRYTYLEILLNREWCTFAISPESAYANLCLALAEKRSALQSAIAARNLDYILANDDFGAEQARAAVRIPKLESRDLVVVVSSLVVAAIIFMMAHHRNVGAPRPPPPSALPHNNATGAALTYSRPQLTPYGKPWPNRATYLDGAPIFETGGPSAVTIDNSRNDSDVFIRLYSLKYTNPKPVRDVFVPANGSFQITSVSVGTYDIRYRLLSSGVLLRSDPITLRQDDRTYSNVTVTLYSVPQGNLKTHSLTEREF